MKLVLGQTLIMKALIVNSAMHKKNDVISPDKLSSHNNSINSSERSILCQWQCVDDVNINRCSQSLLSSVTQSTSNVSTSSHNSFLETVIDGDSNFGIEFETNARTEGNNVLCSNNKGKRRQTYILKMITRRLTNRRRSYQEIRLTLLFLNMV